MNVQICLLKNTRVEEPNKRDDSVARNADDQSDFLGALVL
jgi:hypothetical protein